jgi:hypothetical protein
MSLPNLNYDDWLKQTRRNSDELVCQCDSNSSSQNSNNNNNNNVKKNLSSTKAENRGVKKMHSVESTISDEVKTRAVVHHVAEYYADYVRLMNLDRFFRNDTVVLNVRQIKENEMCKLSTIDAASARYIVHG